MESYAEIIIGNTRVELLKCRQHFQVGCWNLRHSPTQLNAPSGPSQTRSNTGYWDDVSQSLACQAKFGYRPASLLPLFIYLFVLLLLLLLLLLLFIYLFLFILFIFFFTEFTLYEYKKRENHQQYGNQNFIHVILFPVILMIHF